METGGQHLRREETHRPIEDLARMEVADRIDPLCKCGSRGQSCSAACGDIRLNDQKPRTIRPTKTAAGISSQAVPPIAWAAVGTLGPSSQCRNSWMSTASGLLITTLTSVSEWAATFSTG